MRRWGIFLFCLVLFVKAGPIIKDDISQFYAREAFDARYEGVHKDRYKINYKSNYKNNHKNNHKNNYKNNHKNNYKENYRGDNKNNSKKRYSPKVQERGTVKNIIIKKKTVEYWFDDFIAVKMKYKNNYKNKSRDCQIGDRVLVLGLEEDLNDFYIGDFNYGRHLRSKGCKKYIRISDMKKVSENPAYRLIGRIKKYIIDSNRTLYKKNSDILNAVLVADKTTLKDEDKYIFSDSGTSHVMAVSGLHVGIICGIILIFVGKINSIKRLSILCVFLLFYNCLVGGGPSISRAILMTILSCLGFFVFRQVDLINILFIIASIMVLQNPYIIYNISFELSFLAMLSLAIFTKYIKQYVYSDILAGSISVAIFTSPLVLYKFETVSTMGVLGNLVILPMMALIICLDMLSIITYYINIPIYSILAYINSSIIDLVMVLLKRIGDYGVNNIDVRDPSLFKLLTYYIIVVGLAIYLDYYYIEKGKYTRELYLVKEEVVEHI